MVPGEVLARLRAMARTRGMTVFMVVDAALSIVVSRWTGADDVVVGTPVAARDVPGVSDMIGCFSTVVPLRVRIDRSTTVGEVLDRARDACTTAFDHADVPVEQIVPAVGGRRGSWRHPWYSIMLTASAPAPLPLLRGLEVALTVADRTVTDATLTVGADDRGDQLVLALEGDSDEFDDPTIARFAEHLNAVVTALADDPHRRVTDVAMLSPEEHQLLLDMGDATGDVFADATVTLDGLFAEQALASPNAPAVVDADGVHTYAAVSGRVAALAERLRAGGEVPEVVVVAVSPSVDYVVATLAVLHVGSAYVALDTHLPDRRVRLMIEDSRAGLAVVDEGWHDRLRSLTPTVPVVRSGSASPAADRQLAVRRAPDAPAYLVYTSGSSGRPKAVVGTHRAMVNRLRWHWRTFPLTRDDVCSSRRP